VSAWRLRLVQAVQYVSPCRHTHQHQAASKEFKMRINTLLIGSAIVLSTAFVTSVPAAAETIIVTEHPEPHATVTVADLNLGSPEGVARLNGRIKAAAADLCLTNTVEPIDMRMARAKCYRTALSSGQRQIDRIVAVEGAPSAMPAAAIVSVSGR
jgi:UrcA family protein